MYSDDSAYKILKKVKGSILHFILILLNLTIAMEGGREQLEFRKARRQRTQ